MSAHDEDKLVKFLLLRKHVAIFSDVNIRLVKFSDSDDSLVKILSYIYGSLIKFFMPVTVGKVYFYTEDSLVKCFVM